jgi:hypothetical protein
MTNFWHSHHMFLSPFIGYCVGSLTSALFFRKRLKKQKLANQNSRRKTSPLSIWPDTSSTEPVLLARKEQ